MRSRRSRSYSRSRSRSPPRRHSRHIERGSGHEHGNSRETDRDRGHVKGRESERKRDGSRSGSMERNSKRHRGRSRERSRSRSASPPRRLPNGAEPLSESDYFQKSDEFRLWLKEEKRKYFDELSGDKARSYFRKFVKAWNNAKLPSKFYVGLPPGILPATTNTSYKWSFASKIQTSKSDSEALHAARAEVGLATYKRDAEHEREGTPTTPGDTNQGTSSGRRQGPTLPTPSDLTYASELQSAQRAEARAYAHAQNKKETKGMVEDLVGPKPVGREGMLEKKALRREGDREFRERKGGDEGLEVDEGVLMGSGGGDSFQAVVARREMGKRKYEQRQEERVSAIRERASAMREKEKTTMDMFQQLAKQRFG